MPAGRISLSTHMILLHPGGIFISLALFLFDLLILRIEDRVGRFYT